VTLNVLAFYLPWVNWIAFVVSIGLVAASLIDILLLYSRRSALTAERILPERLSNGDDNPAEIIVTSNYSYSIRLR
jgi:uncharacterized protein (DUF58 family)